MGRRDFLVKAGLVAGGVVLTISASKTGAFAAAFEDVTVNVGADSPLAKVGGWQIVDSTAGKLIVVRQDKAKYSAVSAICTHKGAVMAYNPDSKQVECPKHGSKFDGATGAITHGPASQNLKSYPAKGSDSSVTIVV